MTLTVALLAGCGSANDDGASAPSSSAPQVSERIQNDLARQIVHTVHGQQAQTLCQPPDNGQAQCSVRVQFAGRRPDHAYGVAIRLTADGSEYTVVTSWDDGEIRSP